MFMMQLTLAFRYLWGRKLRTFLTTLAIFFGTMVIFATNLMMPTMMKAFEANFLAASGQVDVTITHKTGEAFPTRVLNQVKTVPGIRAISGSLSRTVNIPADFYRSAQVMALTLTGIDPVDARTVRSYPVETGRFLHASEGNNALITTSLARELGLKLGDKLHLPTTEGVITLRIIGLQPERAMPGNEEILVSLQQAQRLLDLHKRINTIEINLNTTDEAQREAIQSEIEALLGEDYSLGALSSNSEIFASMQMGQMAFNMIGFLAMFMGAFIIFNTFRTIIAERRRDIGMLRTIGANRQTIVGIILTEGLIQGALGTMAGIFIGYIVGSYVMDLMGPVMSQFMNLKFSAPVVQPSLIGTTVLVGVGMTVLAGLIPAVSASKVSPLEALRPILAETEHKIIGPWFYIGAGLLILAVLALISGNIGLITLGGLCLLIGLVLVAPALVKPIALFFSQLINGVLARDGTGSLAQNNLSRQPTRAAVTASATMIGLAIIVGLGGAISSITGGFMKVVERSLGSDYLVMPPSVAVWDSDVGAKQELAKKLRAIPGVSVVSTLRFASSTLDGDAVNMLGIDPETYPQVASLTFNEGDPSTAYRQLDEGPALIINGITSSTTGLLPGDWARVSTPTGQKEYQVIAIAGDYLNAKVMTAYISHNNLARDFRKKEDIFYQINIEKKASPELIEQKFEKILEDYPQFSLVSGRAYLEETKTLFDAIFAGYGVLLAVLSVPSLIALLNTLTIGVLERTREIGMLRAIGATRRQVGRIVVIESVLLAAIGTAFGLLAGLYLGYIILSALTSGGFPVEYSFPYTGLIAAVAAGLLFGAMAAIVPARQASGMVIVQSLRYE